MNNTKLKIFIGVIIAAIGISYMVMRGKSGGYVEQESFDGQRAFENVVYQVDLGPRIPDSIAQHQTVEWITETLNNEGWDVEIQSSTRMEHQINNVVAKKGNGNNLIIIGAHYDTRMVSDQESDINKKIIPVPGANDGASGVAVLLELGRVIPDNIDIEIWLVFFNAEDNGNIPNWEWILGSSEFVDKLEETPESVIIIDMVGDKDLAIYYEKSSNVDLRKSIWEEANSLGYHQFILEEKFRMIDDHTPFVNADIPVALIIDFDYPYWHTTNDTTDKVSSESLEAVGNTLLSWIMSQ